MRLAKPTEFETHSCAFVDLLAPRAEDIDLVDVVFSLAKTCRFTGHPKGHYSVAQHSCFVANLLPEQHRIHGLVHDMPKFGMGDLSSPMKLALARVCPEFKPAWRAIEDGLFRAIYERIGIPMPTDEVRDLVKKADLVALATEKRDVMLSPNAWNLPYPPSPRTIRPVASRAAVWMLADALDECGVKVGGVFNFS